MRGDAGADTSALAEGEPPEISTVTEEIGFALTKAGVRDDDPIRPVFTGLIILFERVRREAEVVKGMRQAAEASIALMKRATERCNAETLKLERTFGTLEIRSHHFVTQTVQSMADQVAEKMRDQMVIVERRHNRIVLWRRAGFLTAVVVAIFIAGFAAARYGDSDTLSMMNRCLAHPFVDTGTGGLVCEVGAPRPSG